MQKVSKKIFNIMLSLFFLIGTDNRLFNFLPVFAQEAENYVINIGWDDANNQYNTRPDFVTFKVTDNDFDHDGVENIYYSTSISATDNWTTTISMDPEWVNPYFSFGTITDYHSVLSKSGNTYTKTYIYNYSEATDDIFIDIAWNENPGTSSNASLTLNLKDQSGAVETVSIPHGTTSATVSSFPFIYNGAKNTISATVNPVSGYDVTVGTSINNKRRAVYISATAKSNIESNLPDGYTKTTWENQGVHIYKQSPNEKIAILTSPRDSNGKYTTLDIKAFEREGIKINAIVNASYFQMGSYPLNSYQTTAYGRIQGMTTDGKYINSTTAGPGDGITGNKPYMDLVIEPNNNIVAGDMDSWDYHWGEDIGFPNEVQAGVSPAGVEILNGQIVDKYSPAVGYSKITTANTQTALVKCDDGRFAFVAVSGKLAPKYSLQNFATAYNMTELSVYDSGGSTQLGYRNGDQMVYPVYTGRRLPNVWIFYEETDTTPDEPVTVNINFVDVEDYDQQDLTPYRISVETMPGVSVPTDSEETVAELLGKNYVFNSSQVPTTVDGTALSYTIEVTHKKKTEYSCEFFTKTREIHFIDSETEVDLIDPELQTFTYQACVDRVTDLVTNKKTETLSDIYGVDENSKFSSMVSPEITGHTPLADTIPEEPIIASELTAENTTSKYYVKYSEDVSRAVHITLINNLYEEYLNDYFESPITLSVYDNNNEVRTSMTITEDTVLDITPAYVSGFDFVNYDIQVSAGAIDCYPIYQERVTDPTYNATYNFIFKDINDDPQNLTGYTRQIVVKEDENAAVDLTAEIASLQNDNYKILNSETIPARVYNYNFKPSGDYNGTTPAKVMSVLYQYNNPATVIGNGNMRDNGCVPTSAAMLLSGFGMNVSPETLGWYLYSTDSFNGSHGHGGTDLAWSDVVTYATNAGTPLKVKYLYDYDSYVDALKSGAVVGMAVYYGGGTHARLSTGYNNGTTTIYDPIEGIITGASVSGQWANRSQAAVDTLSGTSFAAIDAQTVKDIVIQVDHKTAVSESVPAISRTYTRTINYVYANGSEAKPSVVQNVSETRDAYNVVRDLVTNEDVTEIPETVWTNDKKFEAVVTPTIEDFTPDIVSVPEETVTATTPYDHPQIVTVVYSPNSQASYVVFEDINSNSQDLSNYKIDYSIASPTALDISDTIVVLESKGYSIKSQVPDTINPGETITINVDHNIRTTTIPESEETFSRTISYKFTDGSKAHDDTVQSVKKVIPSYIEKIDAVTSADLTEYPSETWPSGKILSSVTPATINGYTPSPATIEAVDVTSGDYDETEAVVYYGNATVQFTDTNANPQDLSEYTVSKSIVTTTNLDLSDTINALDTAGYKVISTIPETIVPEEIITIEVDHKTEVIKSVEAISRTYTRTIDYVYANGSEAKPSVTQTVSETRAAYDVIKDLVTNADITEYPETVWTNDKKFAAVTSPTIENFSPDISSVPEETVTATTPYDQPQIVTVHYSPSEQLSHVVFEDINSNSQDLSEYQQNYSIAVTTPLDIAVIIETLEANGYTVESQIPETIDPGQTITINVDHGIHTTTIPEAETTFSRIITYKFSDGSSAQENTVQSVKKVIPSYVKKIDAVTSQDLTEYPSETWPSGKVLSSITPTAISGYTASVATIPAVDVTSGEYETNEEVTYYGNAVVQFTDTNTNPQNLSEYTVSKPIVSTTNLDISDSINALGTAGYKVISVIPETIEPEEIITIEVDHKTEIIKSVEAISRTYTRTIDYVYANGSEAKPSVTQTVSETRDAYDVIKDLVTNADITEYPETVWTNDKKFAAVVTPTIEDFTPDITTVPEETITATTPYDQPQVVTVHYSANAQASFVVFEDINTNSQDLSDYQINYSLSTATPLDIADTIATLESKGYSIESQIPDTINPGETITINVDHVIQTTTIPESEETFSRTITYKFTDGPKAQDDTVQSVKKVTPSYTKKIDAVTSQDLTEYPSETWPSGKILSSVTPATISGYTPSPATIEAVDVTSGDYDETETVVYYENATVQFIDTNANPQDLSEYTVSKSIITTADLDLSDTINALDTAGYKVISTIPETIVPEEIITIEVDHKTQETPVAQETSTFTRTINYKYKNGSSAHDSVVQTLSKVVPSYTKTVDLVTSEDLTTYPAVAWPNGSVFPEILSPAITNYEPDIEKVASQTANLENPNIIVDVTYSHIIQNAYVIFNDINPDFQSLSSYDITYRISEETTIDISDKIAELEALGFTLVSTAPVSIQPGQTIYVKFNHQIQETEIQQSVQTYRRIINFIDDNNVSLKAPVVQELTKITPNYTKKQDKVTNKDLTDYPTPIWDPGQVFEEVVITPIANYTTDIEKVEEEIVDTTQQEIVVNVLFTPAPRTATVIFNDINNNPQNLETYTKTFEISSSIELDISDKVSALETANFVIVSDIPNTISPEETIVIDVNHKTQDTDIQQSETEYKRTIKYLYMDESIASSAVTQTIKKVIPAYTQTKDLVTNQVISTVPNPEWPDGSQFQAVTSPTIQNFKTATLVVPAAEPSELNQTVNVYYVNKDTDIITVLFNDTDADKQDLSTYTKIFTVEEDETISLDINETIASLENKHFVITSNNVPATISYTGNDSEFTVSVSHDTKTEDTITDRKTWTRTIEFVDSNNNPVSQTVIQTVSAELHSGEITTDLVTQNIISSATPFTVYNPETATLAGFTVPAVENYEPNITTIEAIDVRNLESTDPLEVTVTYSKPLQPATVSFIDINENKQDLSAYTKNFSIAEETALNIEEDIRVIESLGYTIISEIPQTIAPNDEIVINVNHGTSTQTVPEATKTFKRIIHYVYVNGTTALDDKVQTLTRKNEEYTITTDIVTNTVISNTPEYIWENGRTFESVVSPTITNYLPDVAEVESQAVNEEVETVEKTVIYTENLVYKDSFVEFIDTNSNPQNLEGYKQTFNIAVTTNLDISTVLTSLRESNYIILSEIPETITPGETIKINVDHSIQETPIASDITTYERIISYVYEGAGTASQPVRQVITKEIPAYTQKKDLVTGTIITSVPSASWPSGTEFPAIASPEISGYLANPLSVPAKEPVTATEEVTVLYTEYSPVETVDITVNFIDINTDSQSLTPLSVTAEKGSVISNNYQVSSHLTTLQNNGYKIVSGANEVVTDADMTITVDHKIVTSTTSNNVPATRKIHLIKEGTESQVVEQNCNVVEKTTQTIDKVTNKVLQSETTLSGTMPSYSTTLTHWKADRTTIPAYDFQNGYSGFVKDEYVNYTRETVNVSIMFNDINSSKTDVSRYNFQKEVPYGTQTSITTELSSAVNALEQNGYVVLGQLPQTVDGVDKTIAISVNHATVSEDKEEPVTYMRTIRIYNNTVIQTVKLIKVTPITKDKVTGNTTKGTPYKKATGNNSTYFEKYKVPAVDGYTASPTEVAAVNVLTTDVPETQIVEIKYTKKATPDNNSSNSGNNSSNNNNSSSGQNSSSNNNQGSSNNNTNTNQNSNVSKPNTNTNNNKLPANATQNNSTVKDKENLKTEDDKKTEVKTPEETAKPSPTPEVKKPSEEKQKEESTPVATKEPEIKEKTKEETTTATPEPKATEEETKESSPFNPLWLIPPVIILLAVGFFILRKSGLLDSIFDR